MSTGLSTGKAEKASQTIGSDWQSGKICTFFCGKKTGVLVYRTTVKKVLVNGISALHIDGATCYEEDYGQKEYYFGFAAYLLTTNENIFLIVFDSCEGKVDESLINCVMNSLLVNGTYFEGDKLNATHDFSKALPFEQALAKDVDSSDNSVITESLEDLPENFFPIIMVVV